MHLFDYNTHSSSVFSLSSLISLRVMCSVPELRAPDVFWGIRLLSQDPYLNSKREKKQLEGKVNDGETAASSWKGVSDGLIFVNWIRS